MDTKDLSRMVDVVEDLTESCRRGLIVPKGIEGRRAEADRKTREFHAKLMEERVWSVVAGKEGRIKGGRA